jgi:hypothetical protein
MARTVTNISKSLAQLKDGGAAHDIVGAIERLIGDLESIPNGDVRDTILRSAEVIFCTLASVGGLVFKSMVELYPRGLNMMDNHGMTPLDQLCCSARRTEPNVELLNLSLKSHSQRRSSNKNALFLFPASDIDDLGGQTYRSYIYRY